MRLLNTTTLELTDFLGDFERDEIPPYAILSHVWSDEEVSYEAFIALEGMTSYGYQKTLKLCTIARTGLTAIDSRHHGRKKPIFDWAWIDTCCIDKRSSSELSEAINSMFQWYRNAAVCLVFLADVPLACTGDANYQDVQQLDKYLPFSLACFEVSKWFTRGWTLQELVAPLRRLFYNSTSQPIGHAHKLNDTGHSLHLIISAATSINVEVLQYCLDEHNISESNYCCIARRMSWASARITSRLEDIAYCLLGIFGVNMLLLYGEGYRKAFARLQAEILSNSTNQTLAMWSRDGERGLLASHPRCFRYCHTTELYTSMCTARRSIFEKTSRGVELEIGIPRGLWPYRALQNETRAS